MVQRASPLRVRVCWPAGSVSQWASGWLRKLASLEVLSLQADRDPAAPVAAAVEAAASGLEADSSGPPTDIHLWPGAIGDTADGRRAPCEWAIVDPQGTPVLEAARHRGAFAEQQGWELMLLEREGAQAPWCLRRRAHVASADDPEAGLQALADACARLVRQGAIDRSLDLPARPVPVGFAQRLSSAASPVDEPRAAASRPLQRWWRRQKARWTAEQWCIGIIDAPVHEVLQHERLQIRWLSSPSATGYWADPFGMPGDDRRLACERYDERTGLGHLELITLGEDGTLDLREPLNVGDGRHVSFPGVFEMDGACYGLAETAALGRVVLHGVDARGQWVPLATLLDGVAAADPVLFKADGRYWLAYTDMALGERDNLCLAWADRLAGPWTPHANNPVKVDIRGARMAGRLFEHDGRLYRPAQDCLRTYGSAVVVYRIDHISPDRFEETLVRRLEPDARAHLPHGLHTLSAWGERTLVDAKREVLNWRTGWRKLRARLGLVPRLTQGAGDVLDRVFIYVPHLRTGGGEISMLRLAEGLSEQGLDVEVVVHDANQRELPMPRGVTLIDLQVQGTLQAVRSLSKRIRKRRPRWVISAFPHTNLATIAAVKLARSGALSVVTEHAPLTQQIAQQNNWRYRLLPWLVRLAYRQADAVVAVSQGVRHDLKSLAGRGLSVRCIGNPVLPDDFEAVSELEPEHPWLCDGGVQVVLSMCRLSPEKDLPTLVRAFSRLRSSHPCARLLLAGEGPEREPLQALIDELGLQEVAQLSGRTSHPLAWMRKAGVFVLPSTFEGFGNVLVEAMAVGTPVVSTDCPVGPREILDGGRFGDLVPVGDDAAMARAISRALTARRLPDGAMVAARTRTQSRSAREYLALLNHLDLTRA